MSESNFSTEYTNLRLLHTSSYGNSRLFTAQNNGRKVVIKALKADRADNAQCRASLRSEYDVTASLDNKFIRKAIDFVRIEGLGDCIVFEYIDGKSLAEHVRVGTLTEKQVKNVLVDVCDGLSYLHRNNVVHCNLKPENVIVTAADCRAKLIDLGIPETDPDADRELLIKEMEFTAPEIIKGESFDNRADIFSLGKIMEFIGERNISKQFLHVATHCTQFSKEQRYDNIAEVRSAISKGHPTVKVIVLALVLVALAALAYIYVPKIAANVDKERAARRVAEFNRELEKMQNELPELCEKYELKSLSEPIAVDWSDDSVRYMQGLSQYIGHDEAALGFEDISAKAIRFFKQQRAGIEKCRQNDFNRLLVSEFENANDSLAVALRTPLVDPTDEQLLIEAEKWLQQMK
ncbi:MAG: protein kinase [Salinivirgaceae bacterium]|nr:protein kinase [Salinivirgaceae bacterium]